MQLKQQQPDWPLPNLWADAGDSAVKRGDREDWGDNEARPKDGVGRAGSGVRGGGDGTSGQPTAVPTASGPDDEGVADELTVHDADDPALGLTDSEDEG